MHAYRCLVNFPCDPSDATRAVSRYNVGRVISDGRRHSTSNFEIGEQSRVWWSEWEGVFGRSGLRASFRSRDDAGPGFRHIRALTACQDPLRYMEPARLHCPEPEQLRQHVKTTIQLAANSSKSTRQARWRMRTVTLLHCYREHISSSKQHLVLRNRPYHAS